ncbi:GTP cyclohydrolase FolE2 [Pseudomonas sp. TTU2014-080ASC]|uniref:GTP cyclohydrolase FolE2 n=1 Tax=Pseudomonas sp. TTU2014-080ASC TaxID=1729724 RepID=UPI0007187A40|nr:GTP cyclohydrolase FolE2 [Pseudomonas sp. TTU2014-080ASC]KRW61110.1 GTP cyclohydrolase [Pseudomonas sp. TTU2014-080ASC]
MNAPALPDIATQSSSLEHTLDWVGMEGITLPVTLAEQPINATVDASVSLDDGKARGIHMSRLFLGLHTLEQRPLTLAALKQVLKGFLDSHAGLSEQAYIRLSGEAVFSRPALISALSGWKSYPFTLRASQSARGFHVELLFKLSYSSTCPCSAALARQLIQQQFSKDFGERPLDHERLLQWLGSNEGIVATPHSQRSEATLQVRLPEVMDEIPLLALIDRAEQALGTAVQTAVKRADEQAFALANGQNLMFCEDAARRLHQALLTAPEYSAFKIKVVHAESLHAHDAVAQSSHNWGR